MRIWGVGSMLLAGGARRWRGGGCQGEGAAEVERGAVVPWFELGVLDSWWGALLGSTYAAGVWWRLKRRRRSEAS